MNTFKKIAAVAMAAATLATTMVSVSAKDAYVGKLISTYNYSKVPTISLSQLDDGAGDGVRLDNIYFESVDWLKEGNAVLNITTTANLATKAGCDSIEEDLDKLRLDFIPRYYNKRDINADSNYMPLAVQMGGKNKVNVFVGSNEAFTHFDMTRVSVTDVYNSNQMKLTIDYKIEGYAYCILPNFVVNVGGHKSKDTSKITNVKFSDWDNWEDGAVTTGTITLNIPKNEVGNTLNVNINGYKVGTVTVNAKKMYGYTDYNAIVKNVR